MKDLHNNVEARLGLSVQDITTNTTTEGEIIDTAGYEGLEFAIGSGTITDGAYAVSVWESDDSGMAGEAVVPSEETLGNADFAAVDDDEVHRIGSVGKRRYQQLKTVSTGVTTGGTNFFAVAIMGKPHHMPVA